MDRNGNSWHILYQSSRAVFSGVQGSWRIETICECTCVHNLLCYGAVSFLGTDCNFSKYSLSVTQWWVIVYCFRFAHFFELSSKFWTVVDPSFWKVNFFCNHGQKCKNHFLGIFCFLSFRLQFYQTHLDELVDILHRYYYWLIYQFLRNRYTIIIFEFRKRLHSLEFTCGKSNFRIETFRMQNLSHLWFW